MAKTRNAIRIIDGLIGDDQGVRRQVEEHKINFHVARMIYDARTRAGLTQADLARLIGSRQPVIARLEDADYEGHSLTMLQRIARALNLRLTVRLSSTRERKRA